MSGKDDVEFDDEFVPEKTTIELAKEFVEKDAGDRIDAAKSPRLQAAIEVLEAKEGKNDEDALVLDLLREHAKPRDGKHELAFVSEDDREATFACNHCGCSIAFALPGLGDPSVGGQPGERLPPANFAIWMDRCPDA